MRPPNPTGGRSSGRDPLVKLVVSAAAAIAVFILVLMVVMPLYGVYRKEQKGKAALAEARSSKQVQLEEAKANLESEKLNALAEIERAKGAAEAIKLEGGGLTAEYIQYLWVRQQGKMDAQTIYVPTEAGLPVLEAGKRP
jgi:hypothetical protein